MSSAAFKQFWLDTDTFMGPMTPPQIQKLRALCEKFYEAGRKASLIERLRCDEREPLAVVAIPGINVAVWDE